MEQEYRIVKAKNLKNNEVIELKIFESEDERNGNIILSTSIDNKNISSSNYVYFKSYQELRDKLLENGYGLLCIGSKLNAIQSPMASASNKIYLVEIGKSAEGLRSLYEYCDIDVFPNTLQQNEYFNEWINSQNKSISPIYVRRLLIFIIILAIVLIFIVIFFLLHDKEDINLLNLNGLVTVNKELEKEEEKMKFKKLNERRTDTEVSYIFNVLESTENNIDEMIKVPGKLKTLFGEPNYKSINNEDWFGYFLEYEDKYFEVYGSSAETHIGGDSSYESLKIASELAQYINSAKVTDYEWTSYYMDFELKVTCGVKNGVPFQKMEQLNLSEEEFTKLYHKIYNLD